MVKRSALDKAVARERRDKMAATAARAELSLTVGVREMRAISGMTQEEFGRHRGVSARTVKALELGQGNPTVALLNRIGEFFGLEVAFVPRRPPPEPDGVGHRVHTTETAFPASDSQLVSIDLLQQQVKEMKRLSSQLENLGSLNARLEGVERLAAELEQFRTLKGS